MLLLLPNLQMGASPADAPAVAARAETTGRNWRNTSFQRPPFDAIWRLATWLTM